VLVDEHQVQQVLVNLVTNAVQAMNGGGKLVISSRHGKGGGSVEIAVADTGKGIPPEFLPHVFDPFFSTKGEGGTGLGLSVSYGIIKNHKGDIRVESKPGVGTTFTLELPALMITVNYAQLTIDAVYRSLCDNMAKSVRMSLCIVAITAFLYGRPACFFLW
jgi:signal transduction histidine kinase